MGEYKHSYDHMEKIFFLSGPCGEEHENAGCPSCRYKFTKKKEMNFCTFCGNATDDKCLRKTRIYPHSKNDERGKICLLCDRKFFMHKEVEKVYDLIHMSKVTLVSSLQKLESNGLNTKFESKEKDRSTNFTQ